MNRSDAGRAGPAGRDAAVPPVYDSIGRTYVATRRPDPRIARAVDGALGDVATVVNVGAGAGAYEPPGRTVAAIEPSAVMIRQRPAGSAPAVRAGAGRLPLRDGAADATLAVLTMHHWSDALAGLREMARVARRRVVVLTWDAAAEPFWLVRDYFPGILELDRRIFLPIERFAEVLRDPVVVPVPIPADCRDGFLGAWWRRPEAYLDDTVRAGISSFARIDATAGLAALRDDLASGRWSERNAAIRSREALDLGYRLVVGAPRRVASREDSP